MTENDTAEVFEKCTGPFFRAFRRTLVVEIRSEGSHGVGWPRKTTQEPNPSAFFVRHARVTNAQKVSRTYQPPFRATRRPRTTPLTEFQHPKFTRSRRKARTIGPVHFQKLQPYRSRPILLRFGPTEMLCYSFAQTNTTRPPTPPETTHSGMSADEMGPTIYLARK